MDRVTHHDCSIVVLQSRGQNLNVSWLIDSPYSFFRPKCATTQTLSKVGLLQVGFNITGWVITGTALCAQQVVGGDMCACVTVLVLQVLCAGNTSYQFDALPIRCEV